MSFNPNLPADHSPDSSAEMRNQLNGLKDLIDAQAVQITAQQQQQLDAQAAWQAQFAPITPQLNRDGSGAWSVIYAGPAVALWQVWSRCDIVPAWGAASVFPPANFPSADSGLMPFGAQWWQIKIFGSDGSNNLTPFSNIVSVGPVPGN